MGSPRIANTSICDREAFLTRRRSGRRSASATAAHRRRVRRRSLSILRARRKGFARMQTPSLSMADGFGGAIALERHMLDTNE
jgi:hypothetical protein